jgi:pimeloyl-ACP methyl ester carboxylesterase
MAHDNDGDAQISVDAWEAFGQHRRLAGFDVFTVEVGPGTEEIFEPLLVIHGFPTCSYDYRHVVKGLAQNRRVLLIDLPGFGLSAKPDMRYSIEQHADVAMAYVEETGVNRLALMTHDMGDTVGGELLARHSEGRWPIDVTRRVLTNGSIYLEMAHLTDGQQLLLSLPDEAVAVGPEQTALAAALAATMAEGSTEARRDLAGDAELICREAGNTLLTRTIRYVEDRRRAEERYTGAIETHPSPLGVIWGSVDPIAVREMAVRLGERRPDATLCVLEGIGHYPMLEAPDDFLAAALRMLEPA